MAFEIRIVLQVENITQTIGGGLSLRRYLIVSRYKYFLNTWKEVGKLTIGNYLEYNLSYDEKTKLTNNIFNEDEDLLLGVDWDEIKPNFALRKNGADGIGNTTLKQLPANLVLITNFRVILYHVNFFKVCKHANLHGLLIQYGTR